MANVFSGKRSDGLVYYTPAASTLIEVGDLVYLDSNTLKPASSLADSGAEPDNQAAFAQVFLGVAAQASATDSVDKIAIHCSPTMEFTLTAASAVYRAGDLLGASEASSGTALEDQTVAKVTSQDLALFSVVDDSASARTTVAARMVKSSNFAASLGDRYQANIATLAGTHTLTFDDVKIQTLDPGGAGRDVILPADEESAGLTYILKNAADASEALTVKDDGGATIATVAQDEAAFFFHDGTGWHGGVLKAT